MKVPAFETLLFEVRGRVALVSLNRPERLNAMNRVMLRELNEACDYIESEDAIFVAVLTGEGKSFSSGFDLKEQAENTPVGFAEWRRALRQDFDAVMRFWNLSKPTVAAVRGHALAGGCELALACDITVAAEDAVFGEPELKFGAGIVVMLLPWLTNPKLAKEIILTGEDGIPAAEAHRIGLVNRVVPEARSARYRHLPGREDDADGPEPPARHQAGAEPRVRDHGDGPRARRCAGHRLDDRGQGHGGQSPVPGDRANRGPSRRRRLARCAVSSVPNEFLAEITVWS